MNSYQTLAAESTGRIVEKKSEFIGLAAPVTTEEQALEKLEQVRASHRTARHNVYAYVLRKENRQRYSDDGEPAKTAGLPVLGAITHAGLTDCVIIVTRYFGGTLLGTGGLVRAYTSAANAALEQAQILTVQLCVTLTIQLPYPQYEPVNRLLEQAGARLQSPVFTQDVVLTATLPAGAEVPLLPQIQELCRGGALIQTSDPFYTPF